MCACVYIFDCCFHFLPWGVSRNTKSSLGRIFCFGFLFNHLKHIIEQSFFGKLHQTKSHENWEPRGLTLNGTGMLATYIIFSSLTGC